MKSTVAAWSVIGLVLQVSCASRPRVAAAPASLVLRPGSGDLSTQWLAEATEEQRFVGPGPGDTVVSHEQLVRAALGDGSQMLLVKSNVARGHVFRDSVIFRRRGLVPVWEHMRFDSRLLAAEYAGSHVRVTKQSGDSTPHAQDATFPEPVFGFNQLDLVVRSLPFRAGYQAVVPLYSEGSDALEMDTVMVVGRTAPAISGGPSAWTIRFADPVIVVTYDIDESTRRISKYEVRPRRGGLFRRVF